jgi:hypothetical protein
MLESCAAAALLSVDACHPVMAPRKATDPKQEAHQQRRDLEYRTAPAMVSRLGPVTAEGRSAAGLANIAAEDQQAILSYLGTFRS